MKPGDMHIARREASARGPAFDALALELADVDAELARVTSAEPPCADPDCLAAHRDEKARLRALLRRERDGLAAELEAARSGARS